MSYLLASAIFGPAFHDAQVVAELDDAAYFRAMLEVEAALARVQARLGVIPASAASSIEAACSALVLNAPALAAGVVRDGVPTLALVEALRDAVGQAAGAFVHHGATSQDVMDTACVLCVRRSLDHVRASLVELVTRLAALADAHRKSIMVARTHGQQALPTTLGLKLVGWGLPCVRHIERLDQLRPRLMLLQLGGAAGTLAAFGPSAFELVEGVASELELGVPDAPWHTQRDAVGELGAWLSLVCGSLGKLGQDVILLCQSEVAELSEAPAGARGSSSSMPQKNNPIRSELLVAAARAVASHVSALHQGAIQEHERGTHGWQLEWLSLSSMLLLAAGALRNARELLAELQVHTQRMRDNLLADAGLVLAEAAVGALAEHLTRPKAQALVKAAATVAREEGRFLIDVIRAKIASEPWVSSVDWEQLSNPESQLGAAGTLIDRALLRLRSVSEL